MENALFPEWLERFNGYLRMRNYSPRTIKKYEGTLQRFARYAWVRQNMDRTRLMRKSSMVHRWMRTSTSPRLLSPISSPASRRDGTTDQRPFTG